MKWRVKFISIYWEEWVIAFAISLQSLTLILFITSVQLIYFIHGNGMQWNGKGVNVVKLTNGLHSSNKWISNLMQEVSATHAGANECIKLKWNTAVATSERNVIQERNEEWIEWWN